MQVWYVRRSVGVRGRKCDSFPANCGGGVPEWEEGDQFWNESERERRFERQFETGAAYVREWMGGQKRNLSSSEQ